MQQRANIGRYESCIEDGTLRLYYHPFGNAAGFSTRMTSEETLQLLEWLSQHHEEIVQANRVEQRQQSTANYR